MMSVRPCTIFRLIFFTSPMVSLAVLFLWFSFGISGHDFSRGYVFVLFCIFYSLSEGPDSQGSGTKQPGINKNSDKQPAPSLAHFYYRQQVYLSGI